MDRFIGQQNGLLCVPKNYLKSNMDRFIALTVLHFLLMQGEFKIQYG